MFRASSESSPFDLFSQVEQFLRGCDQDQLNDPNAWHTHNVFPDQVTKRIPEERFAGLFDDVAGRPNNRFHRVSGRLRLGGTPLRH